MQLNITATAIGTYWRDTTSYVPKAYVGLRTEATLGMELRLRIQHTGVPDVDCFDCPDFDMAPL